MLNAFAKSVLPAAAEKAEDILQKMIRLNTNGDKDVKPDRISFTTCINAWSKSDQNGSASRALAILKLMEDLSREKGLVKISPDIVTYNLVLKCLVSDSFDDKALKAEAIISKMKKRKVKADIMSYNSVIQCCCTTRSKDINMRGHALRIANETLLKISKSEHTTPNPFTFNFYIKACDRLAREPDKSKLIKAAWYYCCSSGQVSQPVLSIIRNTLSISHLEDIFRTIGTKDVRKIRLSDFPSEWSAGILPRYASTQSHQQNTLKKNKQNERRHQRLRNR
uniref:Pentacotripeptide-repeat region of PRORP domain-containing protein n=2 Tax=Eucampia antarctica TaxID=49252 RepID=A0A7S2R2P8_9STRA